MSDVFDNVDNLKFKDRIRVCSASPHLKRDFVNENKIALSISVTNSFLAFRNLNFMVTWFTN